jgi:hypothetical protein
LFLFFFSITPLSSSYIYYIRYLCAENSILFSPHKTRLRIKTRKTKREEEL